ncbi:MAG: hypothetical protein HKN62_04965 [Phycisphaerales bacterium]|nr:hypothetical protein [Phycisphaerales bacterium]
MGSFKLFWNTHKWTGLVLSGLITGTTATGFLLLIKKEVDWIQPPTREGAAGSPEDFIPLGGALAAVYALEHPDFQGHEDIDRIDVRPGDRVYKIRSEHHDAEVQVCAVTGAILSVDTRPSDLIERIHDGSFFGDWAHGWVMPAYAVALLFMVFSGWWLWIEPMVRRRRWRRRHGKS